MTLHLYTSVPVMKDHLSHKTNFCGPVSWSFITGFTVHIFLFLGLLLFGCMPDVHLCGIVTLLGSSFKTGMSKIWILTSAWGTSITPWWVLTTHLITTPTCVYKYGPPGYITHVTQDTYRYCYTHGSNVMTTLTQCNKFKTTYIWLT